MATTTRRRNTHSMSYYRDMVLNMDDTQKLELVSIIIDSMKATQTPMLQKRYTMDDINAMLDEAEADFAAGKGIPDEEVWNKWDEELAREEQYELETAKVV